MADLKISQLTALTGANVASTDVLPIVDVSETVTKKITANEFVSYVTSGLGTYTTYTPTLNGITIGNGTIDAKYCRVNNFVHVIVRIVLGSTSAVTGTSYFTLPIDCDAIQSPDTSYLGNSYFVDISTGTTYPSDAVTSGSLANRAYISTWTASGTYLTRTNISATVPFTWATGDVITFNLHYKAA